MEGYLGETPIDWKKEPIFEKFKRKDWALLYIERYGGIDGAHHKDWVIDQVARILNGSPVRVFKASWTNGHSEFRYRVGKSKTHAKWVYDMTHNEDGEIEDDYEEGIAP